MYTEGHPTSLSSCLSSHMPSPSLLPDDGRKKSHSLKMYIFEDNGVLTGFLSLGP